MSEPRWSVHPTPHDLEREARRLEQLRRLRVVAGGRDETGRERPEQTWQIHGRDPDPKEAA